MSKPLRVVKTKEKNGFWKSLTNQRDHLDRVFVNLKFHTMEDWKTINGPTLTKEGASTIFVSIYRGNRCKMLTSIYPNYPWDFREAEPLALDLLDNEKHREFILSILKEENISLKEWKKLTVAKINEKGGKQLMKHYRNSIPSLMKTLFPSLVKSSEATLINPLDHRYFKSLKNQRLFMDHLYRKLGLKDINEWKNMTLDEFRSYGGRALVAKYNNNFQTLLSSVYPHHQWNFIIKKRSPTFWKNIDNLRQFMEQLACILQLKSLGDFATVPNAVINKYGGRDILHSFKGRKTLLFPYLYPNFPWDFSETKKEHGYWKNRDNQLQIMNDIAKKLNFTSIDDFSDITATKFANAGGEPLLGIYQNNYQLLLTSLYPNHAWKKRKNYRKKKGYWGDPVNQHSFLENLFYTLHFKSFEDWKTLSLKTFLEHSGKSILYHFNYNLSLLLCTAYPNYCWQRKHPTLEKLIYLQRKYKVQKKEDWHRIHSFESPFLIQSLRHFYPNELWQQRDFSLRGKRSKQRWLWVCVNDIYPDLVLLENYRHPFLTSKGTSRNLELDLFIPSLNLAFEYQGEQHFDDVMFNGFSPLELYQMHDKEKLALCENLSIQLLLIPYWWDATPSSLLSSISTLQKKM